MSFTYNPEVQEYLQLNKFSRIDHGTLRNGMVFKKNNICLVFSESRIEVRTPYIPGKPHSTCDIPSILFDWKRTHEFAGFDGQNIFHLMLLLHIMNVLPIKDVIKLEHMDPDRINRKAASPIAPILNLARCPQ